MVRRFAVACAVTSLTFAGLVAVSGPALASAYSCPSQYSCTWHDAGYVTAGTSSDYFAVFTYDRNFSGNVYRYTGYSADESASSMFDRGTGAYSSITYFKDPSCTGASFTKNAGDADSNFGNGTPFGFFNDQVSSAAFDGDITICHG